jgi:hypothetical protein
MTVMWMVLERTSDGTGKAFGNPIAFYTDHDEAVTFADKLLQQCRHGIAVERWDCSSSSPIIIGHRLTDGQGWG